MRYGLDSVCWSVMAQGPKLMCKHSTSPLPRFCGNVVMMQKSLYLAVGVPSIPSSLGLRPLTCPGRWKLDEVGSWSNHAGVPGTHMGVSFLQGTITRDGVWECQDDEPFPFLSHPHTSVMETSPLSDNGRGSGWYQSI